VVFVVATALLITALIATHRRSSPDSTYQGSASAPVIDMAPDAGGTPGFLSAASDEAAAGPRLRSWVSLEVTMAKVPIPARQGRVVRVPRGAAAHFQVHHRDPELKTMAETFVFLHGSWHGGWAWEPTAWCLRELGHAAYTPTYPGHWPGAGRTTLARGRRAQQLASSWSARSAAR
jgi:hypothetical protein